MPIEVLLISGFDRSGKSTASKILEKSGFFIFECGRVVKELIETNNKLEISSFYNANMTNHNPLILEKILAIAPFHEKLVIVGVRSIGLFRLVKSHFPSLKLIFIESDEQIRYERYVYNSESKALEFSLFSSNDSMQIEWGLNKIKSVSNVIIQNNGDFLDFARKIDQLASGI